MLADELLDDASLLDSEDTSELDDDSASLLATEELEEASSLLTDDSAALDSASLLTDDELEDTAPPAEDSEDSDEPSSKYSSFKLSIVTLVELSVRNAINDVAVPTVGVISINCPAVRVFTAASNTLELPPCIELATLVVLLST